MPNEVETQLASQASRIAQSCIHARTHEKSPKLRRRLTRLSQFEATQSFLFWEYWETESDISDDPAWPGLSTWRCEGSSEEEKRSVETR